MRTTYSRRQALAAIAAAAATAIPGRGAPPNRPWLLGANTAITGYSFFDAVALLRKLGFPTIEIHSMGKPEATPGQFPGFRFNELTDAQKQSMREALKGVPHITAHLPYTGHDYFAADDAIAAAAEQVVDTAIEGCAYFGVELAVLHPKAGAGQTTASQWPAMLKRFRRWGDMARARKMRIGLETGYPASVADFVRLIREVDHPAVGATIDVGHQSHYAELVAKVKPADRATPAGIRAYNETTISIIEALGPKVLHLHVHDVDPATWAEHKPLGTGFVDYPRMFRALDKAGFRGALVLEIGGPPESKPRELAEAKKQLESWMRSE